MTNKSSKFIQDLDKDQIKETTPSISQTKKITTSKSL